MENSKSRLIDQYADTVGRGSTSLFGLTAVCYACGLVPGDPMLTAVSVGLWAAAYLIFVPAIIRSAAVDEQPRDPWGAAACLAYGALPFFLYLPYWSQMTGPRGAGIAYPAILMWTLPAIALGYFRKPPAAAPGAGRAIFLGVAGALCLLAAGPVYLGLWGGLLSGYWTPPDGDGGLLAMVLLGAAPFAAGAAYLAIELLGRAFEIDRGLR